MTARHLSLTFQTPDTTRDFATALARTLRSGDVVLLSGNVGSGKTHFARSLIQSLLITPEDVPSPTFTLVQTYETQRGPIWHADLYRLTSVSEIEELGLTDAFIDAICLVEWPDRLADLRPRDALDITLSAGDGEVSRQFEAVWNDPKWDAKIAGRDGRTK